MRLALYLDGFSDELTKISSMTGDGAIAGAALGALSGGKTLKGKMIRGALGAVGGASLGATASGAKKLVGESRQQHAAAQVQPWEPEGYVPSWARQY